MNSGNQKGSVLRKSKSKPVVHTDSNRIMDINMIGGNFNPTETEIRIVAESLYRERMERGEHGTSEQDWHRAEQLLYNVEGSLQLFIG
jgi:hypothetical protein